MSNRINILFIPLWLILSTACVNEDQPENVGIEPGDNLPAFSISLNDGTTLSDASLAGKVGVIEFFNTSCADCRRSLPVLQEVYDFFSEDDGVEIVCISREEDEKSILNYWEANSLSLPFSAQTDRAVYSLFASVGIPRIFISGKDGVVRYAFDDSNAPSAGELEEAVISLE